MLGRRVSSPFFELSVISCIADVLNHRAALFQMPNLLSRIFRSRSTSRDASFRASEPSLNQTSRQPSRTSSKLPSSASVGNLGSYAINPKELEKYKLHKASWEGKISKVRRLTNPAQIDAKDQQSRVMDDGETSETTKEVLFLYL